MLRKVRHENIVLFMGVCMNPPNLCIVTEYIKVRSGAVVIYPRDMVFAMVIWSRDESVTMVICLCGCYGGLVT